MSSASISRLTVLAMACGAVAFLCASLSSGFGWVASIGSAFIGAVSGYRAFAKNGPAWRAISNATALAGDQAERPGSRAYHVFIGPFLSLPPYQRFASLVFLLQSVVSLVLILGFCVAQAAGLDVHLLNAPSFAALFADAYPIDAGATFARTRFDNLFLALVSFYLISLSSFAVALFHSLGPLLRGVRQYAKLWAAIAFFSVCLWLLLFVGSSTGRTSLQKYIIDGDAFGYIVLFVFSPMLWVFIASGLPDDR